MLILFLSRTRTHTCTHPHIQTSHTHAHTHTNIAHKHRHSTHTHTHTHRATHNVALHLLKQNFLGTQKAENLREELWVSVNENLRNKSQTAKNDFENKEFKFR